jgi:hypothetical protein
MSAFIVTHAAAQYYSYVCMCMEELREEMKFDPSVENFILMVSSFPSHKHNNIILQALPQVIKYVCMCMHMEEGGRK